jgi:hypothetical protein
MELKYIVLVVLLYFGVFCMVAAIVIVPLKLRHRQRMAMIEKGIVPGTKAPEAHLRRGLLLCFIGGGLFAGILLWADFLEHVIGIQAVLGLYPSLVCLGIGIAEIIYYRMTRPKAAVPKPPLGHLRRGLILSFVGGGILVFFGISIPIGFTGANEPIQIIILVGIILLAIGIAELIYYRLTKSKATPPAEKETPPSAGRRLVASGDDDADKKTPQIDAEKRK